MSHCQVYPDCWEHYIRWFLQAPSSPVRQRPVVCVFMFTYVAGCRHLGVSLLAPRCREITSLISLFTVNLCVCIWYKPFVARYHFLILLYLWVFFFSAVSGRSLVCNLWFIPSSKSFVLQSPRRRSRREGSESVILSCQLHELWCYTLSSYFIYIFLFSSVFFFNYIILQYTNSILSTV